MPPKYILRCWPEDSTEWLAMILNARSCASFKLNAVTVLSSSFCVFSSSALNFLSRKYLWPMTLTSSTSSFLGGQFCFFCLSLSAASLAWASLASNISCLVLSSTCFQSLARRSLSKVYCLTWYALSALPFTGSIQPDDSSISAASRKRWFRLSSAFWSPSSWALSNAIVSRSRSVVDSISSMWNLVSISSKSS